MSKLNDIFTIVAREFPEITIQNDSEKDFIDWAKRLNVYDDGSAFGIVHYPATRDDDADTSIDPIGLIGNSVESIANAFIALIEKEIAIQKAEFESENQYAKELDEEKKLLEDKELWADLDYERNWSWREGDFGTAAQDSCDRGW
jgi:hypothetical protein